MKQKILKPSSKATSLGFLLSIAGYYIIMFINNFTSPHYNGKGAAYASKEAIFYCKNFFPGIGERATGGEFGCNFFEWLSDPSKILGFILFGIPTAIFFSILLFIYFYKKMEASVISWSYKRGSDVSC